VAPYLNGNGYYGTPGTISQWSNTCSF
jgi:hypothetical protein